MRDNRRRMSNTVILEKAGQGYAAYLPDLPGCVSTGQDIGEIKENIEEAVNFHIQGLHAEGIPVPDSFKNGYSLNYKMDVPSLFEWFSGVLTKSAISRLTGMNPSLISQYVNGNKTPGPKQTRKIEHAIHKLGRELLEIEL